MMTNLKIIERKASKIISDFNGNKLPIDVEKIVKQLGVEIIEDDLGSNVSGVLFIKNGKGTIGYNPDENINLERRRFTIAHELGHYVLHRFDNDVFVDKSQLKVKFNRDEKSSTGEITIEREANAFAAALLMPKELLEKEIEKLSFDLLGDNTNIIGVLADKFKVSEQAMTFRMMNLKLF